MTITHERVKELFDYHLDGYLVWKEKKGRNPKISGEAGWDSNGYRKVTIDGKNHYVHRVVFLFINGFMPKNIDHIDGNPMNNKISNLREATQSQNLMNKAMQSNNKSGVKGLTWCKTYNKWAARITSNKKYHHVGYFENFDEAVDALAKKRSELHQEFARFN